MKQEILWREFATLSPELQQQVIDFIAFLRTRYMVANVNRAVKRTNLAKEPYIGMWRNRKDMTDSTSWVRELRQHEWMNRDA